MRRMRAMITLDSISLQRGAKQLLEGASLRIFPGHKIGVIGANGSGKSSLFKLLLGQLQVDAGNCFIPSDWKIAHMAQETEASERGARDYVIDGDWHLRAVETQINNHDDVDGEHLAKLYAEFEELQGYTAEQRASKLLDGLGFSPSDYTRPVSDFSGGWRIRLNLAQALMSPSDLLLLDEPTNHLDLDTTVWLEGWLQAYTGTLLIISHDRDFLDNVVTEIVNYEARKLIGYGGNYSAYERQKAQRLSQQQQAFEKQQARKAEIVDFVRRFRAKASKAKQAQSRLKELERMEEIAPAHIDSPFHFSIACSEKVSVPLLSLSQADLGYGDKALIKNVNLSISVDTRLGLLGANGAGKSTLIKTLAGELTLLNGSRTCGEHLKIGYFNQHQLEALDMQASCALHLQRISPKAREQEIRNFLGSFGFIGDRALETIEHFSGGEKARLALAIVAWQKPNLLLLDEPTNHLDLEVRHALTVALQGFAGAVIVISHDRHLLRNTVDDFLLVHDGCAEPFDGSLNDYQKWLSDNKKAEKAEKDAPAQSQVVQTLDKADRKEQRQKSAAKREQLKPLTQKLKKLERDIEKLQAKLSELEVILADNSLYEDADSAERLQKMLKDQGAAREQLASLEEQWMEVSEELEALS